MPYRIRTRDRYSCPNSLRAVGILFPILQAEGVGCSGVINKPKRLEDTCKSCDKYINNIERKVWASELEPV